MRLFNIVAQDDRGVIWDFESKSDQDWMDTAYPEFPLTAGANSWRVENSTLHAGTRSSSMACPNDATSYRYKYTILSEQSISPFAVELYWYWDENNVDPNEQMHVKVLLQQDATHRAMLFFQVDNVGGVMKYDVWFYLWDNNATATQYNYKLGAAHSSAYRGLKIIHNDGARKLYCYADDNDTGIWTLVHTFDASTSWTPVNIETRHEATSGNGAVPHDSMYIDDFVFLPGPATGNEITPAPISAKCSKKMEGRGMFSATIRDFELANYATTKLYVWTPIEVWKNDLSLKLGEYFSPSPRYNYNSYLLGGPEALGVLRQVSSGYNAILAQGEATAIGADTMDDTNAVFTASQIGLVCMFSDKTAPSIETDWPNTDSDHLLVVDDSPLAPWREIGANTDLDTPEDIWFVRSYVDDDFYLKLEFEVTNGAAATAFTLQLNSNNSAWTTGNESEIHIYDFTNTQWRKVADLECDDKWATYYMTEANIPAGVIADYYSGDTPPEFHVKIIGGTVGGGTTTTMRTSYVELKTTYSTVFAAEQNNYVIDARTGTQLTFTGQTPQADGIVAGDRYVIGDYLHNIVNNLAPRAAETNLSIDYDTTTNADAGDYRTSMIVDILTSFAKKDNRRVWQALDWVAKCKSSYVSTGITLTEADLVVNNNMERWDIFRDGSQMRRHQMVVGNGNFYEAFQTPTFPCPNSFLHTSNLISSQTIAKTLGDNLLARFQGPKDIFECTVDYDNIAGTDYSTIDMGKTINVDIFGSKFTITNGLIISMDWDDTGANGHLLNTIQVETV